jgi:hypothetical protein
MAGQKILKWTCQKLAAAAAAAQNNSQVPPKLQQQQKLLQISAKLNFFTSIFSPKSRREK